MPNDFLERNLEDIIFENRTTIHTRGLCPFRGQSFRQVLLPSGRKIDILSFDIKNGSISLDIYELKKDAVTIRTACQAFDYWHEIRQLIKGSFKTIEAKLVLVGSCYEPISILSGVSVPIEIYTYEYNVNGINFTHVSNRSYQYHAPDEHFSLGLWAVSTRAIEYTSEYTRVNVGFHSTIARNSHLIDAISEIRKVHIQSITELRESYAEDLGIDVVLRNAVVETVVFPEQPQWTAEFSSAIPYSEDLLEDFDYDDEDDLEDDGIDEDDGILEVDTSDDEDGNDAEGDDYCHLFGEKSYLRQLFIGELKVVNIGTNILVKPPFAYIR